MFFLLDLSMFRSSLPFVGDPVWFASGITPPRSSIQVDIGLTIRPAANPAVHEHQQ